MPLKPCVWEQFKTAVNNMLKAQLVPTSSGVIAFQINCDLYTLWKETSYVTVEMFADPVNESGVLDAYCSVHRQDRLFGSMGTWEESEGIVEAGALNPLFNTDLIRTLIDKFEQSVCKKSPYCRVTLLPLNISYGVRQRGFNGLLGKLLVEISCHAGLGFVSQQQLLHHLPRRKFVSSHWKLQLGLFVWQNREHLLHTPPPCDVEIAYVGWATKHCKNPGAVFYHWDAFQRAFPQDLRDCDRRVGNLFG